MTSSYYYREPIIVSNGSPLEIDTRVVLRFAVCQVTGVCLHVEAFICDGSHINY
ncbi:unnamed protein product [Camellia sinensis]